MAQHHWDSRPVWRDELDGAWLTSGGVELPTCPQQTTKRDDVTWKWPEHVHIAQTSGA